MHKFGYDRSINENNRTEISNWRRILLGKSAIRIIVGIIVIIMHKTCITIMYIE